MVCRQHLVCTAATAVDFKKVSGWLQDCVQSCEHSQLSRSILPWPREILLMDLDDLCLIRASTRTRYLALSYVWGRANAFTTTKSTVTDLLERGKLKDLVNILPSAIRDAMTCVKKLGERYLWVDALCIVQDDASRKHQQISQMDVIYSQAYLTIVADSAENAKSPLPGIEPATRLCPRRITALERDWLRLFPDAPVEHPVELETLSSSASERGIVYNRHGWTFQEELLSSRRLYFNHHNVWFSCNGHVYKHDLFFTAEEEETAPLSFYERLPSKLGQNDDFNDGVDKWDTVVECYWWLIENYTSRRLTYRSDVLDAINGILLVSR
ncbi:heterokaryon incompatibility protein-domain-containing protein [Podospora australis]|uniref:Heterokaryon incompatibility protein-domain-containing protein n=1 Tax=Podospora australis TaxID=1536484 RepID=A0AAN6WRU0_9PEZI|nr:heterokaryon incompatibility protein-domain-containing protein [Podospora australis]